MIKQKGSTLFECNIDGTTYSVRATAHALMRMEERQVSKSSVNKTISQLKPALIQGLQMINRYTALININESVTVLVGLDRENIMIITVINTSKYYPKHDTLALVV